MKLDKKEWEYIIQAHYEETLWVSPQEDMSTLTELKILTKNSSITTSVVKTVGYKLTTTGKDLAKKTIDVACELLEERINVKSKL